MQKSIHYLKGVSRLFSRPNQAAFSKTHGNLSDSDRIFTNLYKDGDPYIKGALKRGDWY
jgi:hypothetical protein